MTTPDKELGSFLFVTTNYRRRRRAGQHRTRSNNHQQQPAGVAVNTVVTVGWEDGGRGSEAPRGPRPWERLGAVALLKALELIWIAVDDDCGEVAESLEVIWGPMIAYWLVPTFTPPPPPSATPGVSR